MVHTPPIKDSSRVKLEMVYDDIEYYYTLTPRSKDAKDRKGTWKCTMYTTVSHQDTFHIFAKSFTRDELSRLLKSPFLKNIIVE
jgi:hypothetical protein